MWRAVGGPVTTSEQRNNCHNQEETGWCWWLGQCGLWMEHCIRHPLSLLSDNIKCDNEQ